MPEIYRYEHGARKLEYRTGPDPADAFSQDAAANKPPKSGMGLTEKISTQSPSDRKPEKKHRARR